MTYTDVIETSDDGRFRVIMEQDTDCTKPMDDNHGWVTSILTHNYDTRSDYGWTDMRDPGGRLAALRHFEDSWSLPADAGDAFIRWMRLYHGIDVVETTIHNGYRDTSNALAWIEPSEWVRVGFDDVTAPRGSHPPDEETIKIEIGEHNNWADGDCWGYIVQKRVTWTTDDDDFDDRDQWEDTDDSCWGFIGRDYAEEEAKAALQSATDD